MPYIPIVPDATTPADDADEARKEHMELFGHAPIPNILTGQCCHPVHDALRRMIESPGTHVIVPFDGAEVVSDDDARVVAFNRAYEERVRYMKEQHIPMLKERKAFRDRKAKT